jgi:hypothetical protein
MLLGHQRLATKLIEHRRKSQGKTNTERVRSFVGQGERRLHTGDRPFRIAQQPQRPRSKGETGHSRILPIQESQRLVLLWIVAGNTFLK